MRLLDRKEESVRPQVQSVSPYLRRPLRSHEEVLSKHRGRVSALVGSIARAPDGGRSPGVRRETLCKGSSIDKGKP